MNERPSQPRESKSSSAGGDEAADQAALLAALARESAQALARRQGLALLALANFATRSRTHKDLHQ